MNKINRHNQNGFVALVSVIIIFAVLIILVGITSTTSFYTRFNVLDYENKKVSVALAEACANTAMVNLARDPANYPPAIPPAGEQITVDAAKTCRICPMSSGSPYTIITRARHNSAYTNLEITGTLTSSNFSVSSWAEQPTYTGSCTLP